MIPTVRIRRVSMLMLMLVSSVGIGGVGYDSHSATRAGEKVGRPEQVPACQHAQVLGNLSRGNRKSKRSCTDEL